MNLRNSGAVVVANDTGCNRWCWQRAVGTAGNVAGGTRDGRASSVAFMFGVTKVKVASDKFGWAALGLVQGAMTTGAVRHARDLGQADIGIVAAGAGRMGGGTWLAFFK